jgi:hypothetical protein
MVLRYKNANGDLYPLVQGAQQVCRQVSEPRPYSSSVGLPKEEGSGQYDGNLRTRLD